MRLMHPNIDAIHMAGYIRHHLADAELHILDGYALGFEATLRQVRMLSPDVLLVHGDTPTATAMYQLLNELTEQVPGSAACTIIFGEHVSALPEEAFERSTCQVVLLGDPEPAALAICELRARKADMSVALAEIPNILFRGPDGAIVHSQRDRASVVDLDTLPPAARDLVSLESYPGAFYKLSDRETSVLVARGCPWRCTYCGPAWHRALQTPRFRVRSAVSVVDELERLQRDHHIDDFMLDITTFNFSPRWGRELCHEILRRGLRLNLKTHLRADRIDPEMLLLMRRAGFWMIYLGIESANDRTLAGVRKQVTVAQIEYALDALHASGIKVVAELMNLLFWEEDGDLVHEGIGEARSTLRFARRMFRRGRIHAMYWTPMTPVPASESYAIALRHRLIPDEVKGNWHLWFPIQRPIASLPGVSLTSWYLIQWLGKAHQTYFILASRVLHRSVVSLVVKRAAQMIMATLRAPRAARKAGHST
jgi:radical SAM superfamily enzyme YgiQ (UPF0313 family)